MSVVEVSGLVQRHGDRSVLDGVDLQVAEGEVAVIVGPSGGGKSTLLRCLNGLVPFGAGQVRVAGVVVPPSVDERRDAATLRALRRRVGMVFQQFHLFPHLSVLDNLVLAPTRVHGVSRAEATDRAMAWLARVGLADRAAASPEALSGGQQQRVAIARALVMSPDVLLLDEPTSALDPVMAREVADVVGELAAQRQAMVVVTHALHLARAVGHSVHVMADGRVVERGPPSSVLSSPSHAVTRGFLDALPGT